MKRPLLAALLLSFSFSLSFGQGGWCGTPQDDAFMQDLIENKKDWDRTLRKGFAPRFVPITFHLVADNSGGGRMGLPALYKGLCTLNERYEQAGVDVYFYIADIKEINRDGLYNNPRAEHDFMRISKDNSSMNIFVVNSIGGSGGGGTTLGYYVPNLFNDFIVIRKSNIGDPGYTLEHEIGHFFTLAHPHRGWEDEGWRPNVYPQKIQFLEIGSSQTNNTVAVELVDRSNCEVSGDNICDTQADYGRGFTCGCCVLNDVILDRNCDTLITMMNNIMGYSAGCATWEFTPDQITAIQTSFDASNREYLRREEITEYTPAAGDIVYNYPPNMGFQDEYDIVTLRWEAIPNAKFYIVDVAGTEYTTDTNSFTVTDLSPNQQFIFWGVKAFNEFGGGCSEFVPQYFGVGDEETSAVTDLGFVNGLNVFPNPVNAEGLLTVSFDSSKSFSGDVKIYDITGKTIYHSRNVSFAQGSNGHQISLNGLAEGIHILEIRTEEGSITEKLIIE